MILLDTSGLLAALDPDERSHAPCAAALMAAKPPLILSPFVLAEIDYLVRRNRGVAAELQLLEQVAAGALHLADFGADEVAQARHLIEQYSDLDIGLTDASIVVLAERHDADTVLTLDHRHFRAITRPGGRPFRIEPGDN